MTKLGKADHTKTRDPSGSSDSRSTYVAIGALALMALIWGYNWVATKVALDYAAPAVFVALRTFLGAAFLFFLLAVLRRRLRPSNVLLTLAVGLPGTTGAIGLMTWALKSGGAGKTSVLVYTMPLWLLLLSWTFLRERLRGTQWFSVALAVAGLFLVLEPWRLHGGFQSNALAVGAGICWASSSLAAKILSQRHRVDLLLLNAWQLLLGSVPLVIVAFLLPDSSIDWSGSFIAALVFNVVPVTGLGMMLWFYALRVLPAGTAGLATLATPVLGVTFAWIQLDERPGLYEAVGMLLIMSALLALGLRQMVARRGADAMMKVRNSDLVTLSDKEVQDHDLEPASGLDS